MKKLLLLVFLIFIVYRLRAQEGAPLLTNFKESTEIENQSWAICQDDNNVMLFANRRGILTFDGQGWNFIPIPTIPYSLKYSSRERKVYVGVIIIMDIWPGMIRVCTDTFQSQAIHHQLDLYPG